MKRTSNGNCRQYVVNRTPFQANNIFAHEYCLVTDEFGECIVQSHVVAPDDPRVIESWYVVYSYASHFPMYIYAGNRWYANRDKFSRTTSKHQSQARPEYDGTKLTWLGTEDMRRLSDGLVRFMRGKVEMREAA